MASSCENQKQFLRTAISSGLRVDGRNPEDLRACLISFGDNGSGSVAVKLGFTKAFASVSTTVVKPHVDKPTQGMLKFQTKFSSCVTRGRDSSYNDRADRINVFLERAIKQTNALDTELLNILTGEKVWSVTVSVHITDDFGNALDCCFLAAVAALRSHRRPDVTVVGSKVTVHPVSKRRPVALTFQYIPFACTFGFLENPEDGDNPFVIIDPTHEEINALDGTMTYAMDVHGTILAIDKSGGIALTVDKMTYVMRLCYAKVCERSQFLTGLLKKLELSDRQIRDRLFQKYANPVDAFEPIIFKNSNQQSEDEDLDEEMLPAEHLRDIQNETLVQEQKIKRKNVARIEEITTEESSTNITTVTPQVETVETTTETKNILKKGLGKKTKKSLGKKSGKLGGKKSLKSLTSRQ